MPSFADHFSGAARRHGASAIDIPAHGFVAATNVEGAIHELIDDLSSTAAGTPGAQKVGADAVAGTPHALAVDSQLADLLGTSTTTSTTRAVPTRHRPSR